MTSQAQADATTKLGEFDFRVLVDYSSSMESPVSKQDPRTRWTSMREEVIGFIRDVDKIDSNGVDLVFFGRKIVTYEKVNSSNIESIFNEFSPGGGTPLDKALIEVFRLAKSGDSADKKDYTIVFTDGEPDSKADVEKVIIAQANSQATVDAHKVLIRQIGDDAGTTAWLRKLDDNLTRPGGANKDIVDVKTFTEAMEYNSTAELLLAALND